MSILFSIGIPAYKDKYLKECIDSILSQTYTNFEIIIVNDASPHDLDSIVDKYNDERIFYTKNQTNFGAENVVGNWNKCLSYAKGDYFLLMGDDDTLCPDYLENFSKEITKNKNSNVFHCRSYIINEDSENIAITQTLPEYETFLDCLWQRINGWRQQFISDFVYKTEFLKNNNGFYWNKLAWASDDITSYLAMLNQDRSIIHINKPLLNYRKNPLTISSSGAVDLKLEAIENEYTWYKEILAKNNDEICTDQKDINIKYFLQRDLNKYKRKKIIETIAYSGFFNGKGYFSNIAYWVYECKKRNIALQDCLYASFLALKKAKANRGN
ncbi:glycosyltransferase family 2 protein [Klebsiella sp. GB_Kp049]|uniref:glycosyltransferase family 2 protein n=1 Tax=Klebsiella sp. GB_Kp049 TaxID=3153400 RepID=UPI0032B4C01A